MLTLISSIMNEVGSDMSHFVDWHTDQCNSQPHDMATSLVVKNDQAAITGIRNSGARQLIIAPGNAYTGGHNVYFFHSAWRMINIDTVF